MKIIVKLMSLIMMLTFLKDRNRNYCGSYKSAALTEADKYSDENYEDFQALSSQQ